MAFFTPIVFRFYWMVIFAANFINMDKKEALKALHNSPNAIPMAAIDFLYNLPFDKEIEEKIIYNLEHAYDEKLNDLGDGRYANEPLFYAILAEAYIGEKLINPVINLFSKQDAPDWDLLNEQGSYLLCKLADHIPETVDAIIDQIEKLIATNSNAAYLYLYDGLQFATEEQALRIVQLLENPKTGWKEMLATICAEAKLVTCKPAIEELYKVHQKYTAVGSEDYQRKVEYQYALELYEQEQRQTASYYQARPDWRTHYQQLAQLFEQQKPQLSSITSNIGRNDPCPCGSGKKFKKCCLIQDN